MDYFGSWFERLYYGTTESEAAGYIVSAIKIQREMNAGTYWLPPFSLFIQHRP